MSPRYPRPSTPLPTVPPPTERLVERVSSAKVLVGVAAMLIACGASFAAWQHRLATTDDMNQVRAGAASQIASLQVQQGMQLAQVQTEQRALGERMARLEAFLDDMQHLNQRLLDQVLAIAKVTHAQPVPP